MYKRRSNKQSTLDRIGDLKGKYETLRVEAKGQHERALAKILELNKTIKTQFRTIEQQDKRDVNLLRANKGLEAEYASLQESAESDLTHFETTLKPMGPKQPQVYPSTPTTHRTAPVQA